MKPWLFNTAGAFAFKPALKRTVAYVGGKIETPPHVKKLLSVQPIGGVWGLPASSGRRFAPAPGCPSRPHSGAVRPSLLCAHKKTGLSPGPCFKTSSVAHSLCPFAHAILLLRVSAVHLAALSAPRYAVS